MSKSSLCSKFCLGFSKNFYFIRTFFVLLIFLFICPSYLSAAGKEITYQCSNVNTENQSFDISKVILKNDITVNSKIINPKKILKKLKKQRKNLRFLKKQRKANKKQLQKLVSKSSQIRKLKNAIQECNDRLNERVGPPSSPEEDIVVSNLRHSIESQYFINLEWDTNIAANYRIEFLLPNSSVSKVYESEILQVRHSVRLFVPEFGAYKFNIKVSSPNNLDTNLVYNLDWQSEGVPRSNLQILNLNLVEISDSSAEIVFNTNIPAMSSVIYGLAESSNTTIVNNNILRTEHRLSVTFAENGDYEFLVNASVDNSNVQENIDYEWTSVPPSSCLDLEKPTISQLTQTIGSIKHQARSNFYNAETNLYVISDGFTSASLNLTYEQTNRPLRAVVRVLNPDEEVVYWKYIENENPTNPLSLFEVNQNPVLPEVFCLPDKGVYQIQIFSDLNANFVLNVSEGTEYGVSMLSGKFYKWTGMPDTMWAWAPVHREVPLYLDIEHDSLGLTIFDETENSYLDVNKPVVYSHETREGNLWRFDFTNNNFRFRTKGFPLVLTSSREAASEIHASIERIESGPFQDRLVNHKFQVEMADFISKLSSDIGSREALYSTSPANYPSTSSECYTPENDEDIVKDVSLLGYYSGTFTAGRWLLGIDSETGSPIQNSNTGSHWFGAVTSSERGKQSCTESIDCVNNSECVEGKCQQEYSFESDYWDVFRETIYEKNTPYGGMSSTSWAGSLAAAMYSSVTSHPCNFYGPSSVGGISPYRSHFSRGLIGALVELLSMQENGSWLTPGYNESFYSTAMTFPMYYKTFPSFWVAMSYLNLYYENNEFNLDVQKLKKSWTNALRLQFDRSYVDRLVSAMNQSSHNLVSFQHFYEGIEGQNIHDLYGQLTRLWSHRFTKAQTPAGYHVESLGPDLTYNGMTHWFMATYHGLTQDDLIGEDLEMRESLRKSYEFFNHTVYPEPSGSKMGALSFGHRTSSSFVLEQYGGAKNITQELPEVAVWNRDWREELPATLARLRSYARNFDLHASNLHNVTAGDLSSTFMFSNIELSTPELRFPAEEAGNFIRNFDDEYIAIKKPSYFTGIYAGNPAPSDFYLGKKAIFHAQVLESEGLAPEDTPNVTAYDVSPFNGGGLSMLSFENFGTVLLGTNWSPIAKHGLLAQKNGVRLWEEYHDVSMEVDIENSMLTIYGSLEDTSITYERKYHFLDNKVQVDVKLTAVEDESFVSLDEIIPIPTCTRLPCSGERIQNRKRNGSLIWVNDSSDEGEYFNDKFFVKDDLGHQVVFDFATSRDFLVEQDGLRKTYYTDELQVAWVNVHLPSSFDAGEEYSFSYEIYEE